MDAYLYQGEIYCTVCANLIRDGLEVSDNSETYPQGPYPDGDGEADYPQNCDDCGLFLENPLTDDGRRYVIDKLREYAVLGMRSEVIEEWSDFYNLPLGPFSYADLKSEFKLYADGDAWGYVMHWWFAVAEELYYFRQNVTIPEEWQFCPSPFGRPQNDPDDVATVAVALASDRDLLKFGKLLARCARALKHAGRDY
jgi:hypothetical protein